MYTSCILFCRTISVNVSTTHAALCVTNAVRCTTKSDGDLESLSLVTNASSANASDMPMNVFLILRYSKILASSSFVYCNSFVPRLRPREAA